MAEALKFKNITSLQILIPVNETIFQVCSSMKIEPMELLKSGFIKLNQNGIFTCDCNP